MTKALIAIAFSIVSVSASAVNFDYCIRAQRHDFSPTYSPSGVRTRCGYVNKEADQNGCAVIWTSDSFYSPPACWESYGDWLRLGCLVYNNNGPNIQGDITYCYAVHPDGPSKDWTFFADQTPDNGDGL